VAVDMSQPDCLRRLRDGLAQGVARRVVVVSPRHDPLGARRAIRASASSLVLEQELEAALVLAVRAVAAGSTAPRSSLQNGVNALASRTESVRVFRLAIDGHTNREIATALFLAESTVKNHLSSA
jgi:two-component system, NarL family, response regulator DesR